MNTEDKQEKALKKWNWGGFLLTPIWSIRHGVWSGLFSIIPLLGILVSINIGASGTQKAWKKNQFGSLSEFLKTQKIWAVAGVAIWAATLLAIFGFFSYNLNYSKGMKKGLEIANSNSKLVKHFGSPIQKASFFQGSFQTYLGTEASTYTVDFKARGSRNTGYIHEELVKKNGIWIAAKIYFKDDLNQIHPIIDSAPYINASVSVDQDNTDIIGHTLDKITQNGDGHIVLVRSDLYNDFIQAATVKTENNEIAFTVEYNQGSHATQKDIHRSKHLYSKEQIALFFNDYASGSDKQIDLIEWQKLSLE